MLSYAFSESKNIFFIRYDLEYRSGHACFYKMIKLRLSVNYNIDVDEISDKLDVKPKIFNDGLVNYLYFENEVDAVNYVNLINSLIIAKKLEK